MRENKPWRILIFPHLMVLYLPEADLYNEMYIACVFIIVDISNMFSPENQMVSDISFDLS